MTKLSRQPKLARALVPQRLSSSGTRYHQICATTAIGALSAPAVQNGSLRRRLETQVALRDGLPISLCPRLAESAAAD